MPDFSTNLADKRPTPTTFWQQHGRKIWVLLFWLLIIGGYYGYARLNSLTIADTIRLVSGWLAGGVTGPLLYILLYTLRPLLFFPATILTLLGGFLFGPIGILYTILGSNASAMVAYALGRYFGKDALDSNDKTGVIQAYTDRMRANSFETVLIMRLIFLPYDLVNYAAGFLKINWRAFLLATAIGSLPGTISFVLFGTSFGTLDDLLSGDIHLQPATLISSIVIIGISILVSHYVKKREATKE